MLKLSRIICVSGSIIEYYNKVETTNPYFDQSNDYFMNTFQRV